MKVNEKKRSSGWEEEGAESEECDYVYGVCVLCCLHVLNAWADVCMFVCYVFLFLLLVTIRHNSIFFFLLTVIAFIITKNNQVFMFVITPDIKRYILLFCLSVVFICSKKS